MTELAPLKIVYLGRRRGSDGKTYCAFITYNDLQKLAGLNDAERIEFRCSLYKAKSAPTVIGGTYEGNGELGDADRIVRLATGALKYLGKEEHPHRGVWEAADQAAYVTTRAKAMETRASKDRWLTESVDRIRRTYKKLAPGDRHAFQLWLINELTANR